MKRYRITQKRKKALKTAFNTFTRLVMVIGTLFFLASADGLATLIFGY